jgi:hypothetical protein
MALPTSRDVTLAPGSQVPATLLNNAQDAIVRHELGQRGARSRTYQMSEVWPHSFTIAAGTGYATAVSGIIRVPLRRLLVGERITSVACRLVDNNPIDHVTLKLFRLDDTAVSPAGVQIGATQTSVNGSVQLLTLSGLTETVLAGRTYYVEMEVTHISHVLRRIIETTDVPVGLT